jgi:hypothetical protein
MSDFFEMQTLFLQLEYEREGIRYLSCRQVVLQVFILMILQHTHTQAFWSQIMPISRRFLLQSIPDSSPQLCSILSSTYFFLP